MNINSSVGNNNPLSWNASQKKRVILLGSNGFIGKGLSMALEKDYEVWKVHRNTSLVELFESMQTFDFLINCASSAATADLVESVESNFDYPLKFFNALKIRKWIQISSYYQLQIAMGRKDSYTLEKQRFSEFLEMAAFRHGEVSIHHLTMPHVFGKGGRPGRLVSSAISAFSKNEVFETSSGTQFLPLLHVTDAINGIIRFMENPTPSAACEPFWYGTVQELLGLISAQFESAEVLYGRLPDPIDTCFPRVKFPTSVEGWEPKMQLKEFLEWTRM